MFFDKNKNQGESEESLNNNINHSLQPNISTPSKYINDLNRNTFLQEQLDFLKDVFDGNKTWKDFRDFRASYGYDPNINIDSVRRSSGLIRDYISNGWVNCPTSDTPITSRETVETNYTTNITTSDKVIAIKSTDINNPDELLRAHGFNPKAFKLVSAKHSKWEQGRKDGNKILYSSRISVKPEAPINECMEDLSEYFKGYKSCGIKSSVRDEEVTDDYLVLPCFDWHIGRIPNMEGAENYTLTQEKELILSNIDKYITKFKGRKFKKIYLVIGQDFFNSSFTGFTSSQSHLQDNCVDYRTMYRVGAEIAIDVINKFAVVSKNIDVIGSLGNHSTAEEYWLFMMLKAYYKDSDCVAVDDRPLPRKYLDLGASLVGLGHLDKEGKRIPELMQVEAENNWAGKKNRLFLAGHLHHLNVDGDHSVEIWRIPSLCDKDRWTVENGYVLSKAKTVAFIFNEKEGLTETHFVNV